MALRTCSTQPTSCWMHCCSEPTPTTASECMHVVLCLSRPQWGLIRVNLWFSPRDGEHTRACVFATVVFTSCAAGTEAHTPPVSLQFATSSHAESAPPLLSNHTLSCPCLCLFLPTRTLQSQHVVAITWAAAKLGHHNTRLYDLLLWRAVVVRRALYPQGVAVLLAALARARHRPDPRAVAQLLQVGSGQHVQYLGQHQHIGQLEALVDAVWFVVCQDRLLILLLLTGCSWLSGCLWWSLVVSARLVRC
jgi:hypothetical protein